MAEDTTADRLLNRDPVLSPQDLDSLGVIARRTLAERGPAASVAEYLTWDELFANIGRAVANRTISLATATAERAAIRAFARLSGSRELQDQIAQTFYEQPRLTNDLRRLAAGHPPSECLEVELKKQIRQAEFLGIASDAENVDMWLTEPLVIPATELLAPAETASRHQPISAAALRTLRDRLRGSWDPVDVIFHQKIDPLTDLIASLLAEATWATGLRPTEWTSAIVEIESDRRRALTDLYRDALRTNPPKSTHDRLSFLQHVKSLLTSQFELGPAWLVAASAKADWSRRYGLPASRRIGLHPHTASTKLVVFCAAMAAARVGAEEWPDCCRRVNRRLKTMAADLVSGDKKVTLYSFRHDFIERAKATLDPAEVAALAGHCSPRSKGSYGRPRMRGSGARSAAPAAADPEQVELLLAHFDAVRQKSRTPASPSPSPAPNSGRR